MVVVVVDMVVLVVVRIEKICHGFEGYLGGTVGFIGVGALVPKFQFCVVPHRLGLGFCHGGRVMMGGLVTIGGSGGGLVLRVGISV